MNIGTAGSLAVCMTDMAHMKQGDECRMPCRGLGSGWCGGHSAAGTVGSAQWVCVGVPIDMHGLMCAHIFSLRQVRPIV